MNSQQFFKESPDNRYFDKGLHRWLVEHIYLPLGGSIKKPKTLYNIIRELINVAIPFVFVYLWHGMVYDHVWWLVTNVFGILVEKWAKQLYWSEMIQSFEVCLFCLFNLR